MAAIPSAVKAGGKAVQEKGLDVLNAVNIRNTVGTLVALSAIMFFWRWYQQEYGWMYGMDSTAPEFETYWMGLFWVNVISLGILNVAICGYLWMTRDRHLNELGPKEEIKRIFNFVLWIAVYVYAVYFAASFFGEQDAAWHQAVVRDTSFTPSHIVIFYGTIPLYIAFGLGTFLYGFTRVPMFAKGISVTLVLGVTGPFLILPNLGLNEWGHAFWLMEEIFTHPLHYGFVVLGWSVLALGGLLIQVTQRFIELFRIVYGESVVKA